MVGTSLAATRCMGLRLVQSSRCGPEGVCVLAAGALALVGCTGSIGGPPSSSLRAPSGPTSTAAAPDMSCEEGPAAQTPMRRLTHREYDNAIAELLGDTTHPAQAFVPDAEIGHFDNHVEAQAVTPLLAEQYVDSAVRLAESADLPSLLGCSSSDEACLLGFVQRFGRRAYRRPVTTDETADLIAVYQEVRTEATDDDAARAVLASMLTSPSFLFRPETGRDGSSAATGYEVATRLASFLWASIPDKELLDAAEAGGLDTVEGVEEQARRMLADDRGRAAVEAIVAQWLDLDYLETTTKDPAAYPDFSPEVRTAMGEEVHRFLQRVLWEEGARLEALFTNPLSLESSLLAEFYEVEASESGDVPLEPGERAGILTHPAVLTMLASSATSSPVKRGYWLRSRVLCTALPPPPDGIPTPEEVADLSTRELFERHAADPACSGCHSLIDGLGFGLEHFDGVGRYRTMDDGFAVDATGEIIGTDDMDGPFSGAVELATRLGQSRHLQRCAATEWLSYALGDDDMDDHACTTARLQEVLEESDGDLIELMVALATTNAFRSYGGER